MSIPCKSCGSKAYVKNGIVRNHQRYRCKRCKCNFIEGDSRQKVSAEGKALAVLLYGRGKASYGFIAKLFKVSNTAVLKWIRKVGSSLPEPELNKEIKEIEFDEMWHFINKKNRSYGSGGQWIVVEVEPFDGMLGIVLLKASKPSLKDLKT